MASLSRMAKLALLPAVLAVTTSCDLSGWYLLVDGDVPGSCQIVFNNGSGSSSITLDHGATLQVSNDDGVATVTVTGVEPPINETYDEAWALSDAEDVFIVTGTDGETFELILSGSDSCD